MIVAIILAYDFPPYVSVGGLRPYSWYKYFHLFDIYPVIITRQWANKYRSYKDYVAPGISQNTIVEKTIDGTIIYSPYNPNLSNRLILKYGENRMKIIRKIISGWFEFYQWVSLSGAKAKIFEIAEEYIIKNKVDIIIATGDPFILFKYAAILSKKYQKPFIADYRDLWSLNTEKKSKLLFYWNKYLEKKYVKKAICITTVSEFLRDKISEIFNKDVYIVNNGYDEDNININIITPPKDRLSIAIAGTIYKWHPYKIFLNTINNLYIQKNIKIELWFWGVNNEFEIKQYIEEFCIGIKSHVHFHPRLENEVVLQKLKESHLLLLFNYFYFMGTKIYDYIGLKRCILFCFSNDSEAIELKNKYYPIKDYLGQNDHLQEDLIEKTKSGYVIKDKWHLEDVLMNLDKELKTKGEIECNSINVEQFSRKRQAEVLVNIINTIIKK
ncbi:TPA: hypothetical protein ENS27_00435 [bacterium]|nr:hypothetical protein [bacterium]